ncbi:MAG: NUDIX hydrolase [Verrucomicrobiia bacterium]|jgi:8-oxo-dGTP diphosphatase
MPSDPIIVNKRGDVFVAFHRCPEESIPSHLGPITHALIVVTQGNKSLLLFNVWKKRWELPGGNREEGETPRECALRELGEETNQKVTDAEFRGVMECRLQPDHRTECGALFRATLTELRPFEPNSEASEIVLWDGVSDIGEVDQIDAELLKY